VNSKFFEWLVPLAMLAMIAGCSSKGAPPAGGAEGAPPPPTIQFALVKRESVAVFHEYTAEVKSVKSVDIRTRVGGTLESASFVEGSVVQQGQVLFQIDPEPYYADIRAAEGALAKAEAVVAQSRGQVAQAQGALGQAQARLLKAQNQVNLQESTADLVRVQATLNAAEREVKRYEPLNAEGAIPSQQYDQAVDRRDVALAERDAVKAQVANTKVSDLADTGVAKADVESARANVLSAQASVQAAQAEVQTAKDGLDKANLYLSYTTVRAPFTGIIGRLNLDPGTMIVQGNAVLATLSSIDPVYVDFSIPEEEYLRLAESTGFDDAPFTLSLSNGKTFSEDGEFVLVERNVDSKTGTVLVRTRFRNVDGLLKPGSFGRITMKQEQIADALVIPQRSVVSNQSLNSVYVVNEDNTVVQRTVELGVSVNSDFIVTEGLKEGEKVVVDGLQKIRPGATVAPEEAS
jgi:RND family efflux transporter MFP subunit